MAHAYCRFAQHTPTSFRVTQIPEAAAVSVWSAVHGCLLLEESTPDGNLGDVHDFIDELSGPSPHPRPAGPQAGRGGIVDEGDTSRRVPNRA
ncbi:hypothetical protein OK074_4758 [Actinobacteria bacterium OK074]|nr:hypothetical protein OK074_4758 [Actinobacteria bacterium OK074]